MNINEKIAEFSSERTRLCELLKHRLNTISMDTEILSLAREIEKINTELRKIYAASKELERGTDDWGEVVTR